MNKDNIVLVGLQFDTNLGDQAIFQCTKRMLSDCLRELGISGVEIREVDMMGRIRYGQDALLIVKRMQYPFFWKGVRRLGRDYHIESLNKLSFSYGCGRAAEIQCRQVCDENTKAIIFAGGGIIKYKYQFFHDYVVAILRYAEKHHIPVMISAAGVEGFDAEDKRCNKLKKALNSTCVKCISTRDDIRTLTEQYYRGNTRVRTALVADPACSMCLYYPRARTYAEKTIGLGVVREGLFLDNDIDFSKERMLEFWSAMFREIEKRGYRCKLFCNGAASDNRFALDLLRYMGIEDTDGSMLAERPTSLEMLADTITSFSGIVAARLHASIIAYSYGVPGVGLVWNDKQVMFGKAIGCEERFFCVDRFEPSAIVDTLLSAMEQGYPEKEKVNYLQTTVGEIRHFLKNSLARSD